MVVAIHEPPANGVSSVVQTESPAVFALVLVVLEPLCSSVWLHLRVRHVKLVRCPHARVVVLVCPPAKVKRFGIIVFAGTIAENIAVGSAVVRVWGERFVSS